MLTQDTLEAFVLSRSVSGYTARTCELYREVLTRFVREVKEPDSLTIQKYLTSLRQRVSPVTVGLHFAKIRALIRWALQAGLFQDDPLRGLTVKVPKTLPRVPTDEEVTQLLRACNDTFTGRRNRALISLLADSALRISEALRLRIEHISFATRTISVLSGKGQKDAVAFIGAVTANCLRGWLARHPEPHPESILFVDKTGRALTRSHAVHILHRLSARARLRRKIGPHALRHYCATAVLKQTGDLELVRQILRHETLAMSLKYARLTRSDVSAKFRRASPLDNLRAGR